MNDLAHLSQVDCQFGSCLKSFQNNNLQFDAGLFSSHLAHFVHIHRRARSESERICRMQSEEMQTARSEGKLIWDWPAPLKSARACSKACSATGMRSENVNEPCPLTLISAAPIA